MHHNEHEKERKLDVALGLTLLGETYPHTLDSLGMCGYCARIIPSNHGICMSKVPHYSTSVYDASKLFTKLVSACEVVTIICETEDHDKWVIKFNNNEIIANTLVEAMWKATAKYFDMDMTEILET
jgi:hypothetical protein